MTFLCLYVQVDTLQKAKKLPCVFNNWAVFYKGKFETVNLLDTAYLERILKKYGRKDGTYRRSGDSVGRKKPGHPSAFLLNSYWNFC